MLTPHQADVKRDLLAAIRSGEKRIILEGSAGTGKTFLTSDIVQSVIRDYTLNKSYNNGLIYVTAPTNKALAVLQSKIPPGRGIVFNTVHSALKLRRDINKRTGDVKFVPTFSKSPKALEFRNCKIAFVDESSMINTEILEYLKDYHFPIVFVGDRNQINPVGETQTPVFNSNYPIFNLCEIIRQGAGNPIIDLSRDLDMIWFKQPKLVDGKGYVYNNNLDLIIDDLAEVNGTDDMKYLAWTNEQIDAINNLVRQRRYGRPKKVEKEETLVFNSPLAGFYTNQEVKVTDLSVVTDYAFVPRAGTKFDRDNVPITGMDRIRMKYYRVNGSFNIVHEDSEAIFKSVATGIKDSCKKFGWDWRGYYWFIEQFGDIKYNHAISVHKSQGSTYKTSVVNVSNIDINKDAEEKERLLYTAVTRASDLVILNNVK